MGPPPALRFSLWPLLALAAASLVLLLCAPAQYLGRQQDDLLYIISSQALAGGSYRLFTSPGLPPLVMITPGMPLLLLPLTLAAGEGLAFYQIFATLALGASPWLVWIWLKRRVPSHALVISLLFGFCPIVLFQAGSVMSEAPYLLLVLALLALLERPGSPLAAGGLLLVLTQVRPAGFSLLPAALAGSLLRRQWLRAAGTMALPCAGAALWCLWSCSVSGSVQELNELRLSYQGRDWLHPLRVALDNARFYLSSWGSCYLPWGAAATAVGAALSALSLRGALLLWRENREDPALWMLAAGALLHALWAWQYERYLIPLLPWLLWSVARGLGRAAGPTLALMLACQLLFHLPRFASGRAFRRQPELSETYQWLRSSIQPSEALASPLYVRDGFYAGRPSLPLPDTPDPRAFAAMLKRARARYILWQERLEVGLSLSQGATLQKRLERAGEMLKEPSLFSLVYQNPAEGSRVYVLK